MKKRVLAAFAVLLLGTGFAPADDQPDAKVLLDKAMKAMNGEPNLIKLGTVTAKAKMTVSVAGQDALSTIDLSWQGMSQYRVDFEYQFAGKNTSCSIVLNGDKGWSKTGNETKPAPRDTVPFVQNTFYAWRMPQLLPALRDKAFTLMPLGEVKVGDQVAVGLLVSHKARKDIRLFFEKDSGLPIMSEVRLENPTQKIAFTIEFHFSDYKDFGGIKLPGKIMLKQSDMVERRLELIEIKGADKLDDSHFAEP